MSKNNVPIDRRIRRSKTLLQHSLLKLMETKKFNDITVIDIVKEADVNRGTFYNHYEYKEDILNEIIKNVIADLTHVYRLPYFNAYTFKIQDLPVSSIGIFNHVKRYKKFYQVVVKTDAFLGFQNILSDQIVNLILEDCTMIDPHPELNKELIARFYANGIVGMILEWVSSDFQYSESYMAEQLMVIMKEVSNNTFKTNTHVVL